MKSLSSIEKSEKEVMKQIEASAIAVKKEFAEIE
jgi:hypothetical protein